MKETTADRRAQRRYALLGIHGAVARVRFFTGPDQSTDFTDEDIPLPELPSGVPPTAEVYLALITPVLEQRA